MHSSGPISHQGQVFKKNTEAIRSPFSILFLRILSSWAHTALVPRNFLKVSRDLVVSTFQSFYSTPSTQKKLFSF